MEIQTKDQLELFICSNWDKVNDWIDGQMQKLPIPIYSSVDIRESSIKFAPVDQNIYPAGFNNLCLLDLAFSSDLFRQAIEQRNSSAQKIGIIPESHTKNLFYLDHLAFLKKSLMDAGFDVFFLSPDQGLFDNDESLKLISQSKFEIELNKLELKDDELYCGSEKMDFIILNNDQSDPLELDWKSIKTPIHPTPFIGWFQRQKTQHFDFYEQVVEQFSKEFSIEPTLVKAKHRSVTGIDFSEKTGFEELAVSVDELKKEIPETSKVFVKASQGTYGMGISVVSSGQELLNMNRKNRNKMDIGKNKIKFTSVLLQESVESVLKYDDMSAEVSIYLVDGKPTGGFVRANSSKGSQDNLNSKGMVFRKYCISEIKQNNDFQAKEAVYSIIARLSTLASGYEMTKVMN